MAAFVVLLLTAGIVYVARTLIDFARTRYSDPDWEFIPNGVDPRDYHAVQLPAATFVQGRGPSVELWMPFERITVDRFRSQPGALLLSAAAALTADELSRLPVVQDLSGSDWMPLLSINPDNFHAKYPVEDVAVVNGFRGVVVRDGQGKRAYFIGGPALARQCALILDRKEREMMPGDLKKLDQLPDRAICYATSAVEDGKLTGMMFLGAVRPGIAWTPSREALAGVDRMIGRWDVRYDTSDAESVRAMNAMCLDIAPTEKDDQEREDDPMLILSAKKRGTRPQNFAEAIWNAMHHIDGWNQMSLRAMLSAGVYGIVAAGAVMRISAPWLGVMMTALSALLMLSGIHMINGTGVELPSGVEGGWKRLILAAIPGVAISILLALFLPVMEDATATAASMCVPLGAALALGISFPARMFRTEERKRAEGMLLMIGGALLFLALVIPLRPLGSLFGLVMGTLAGIGTLLVLGRIEQRRPKE